MLAYFNKSRNEIVFMEENNKGVITVNNGVTYVKTNNVYQYTINSLGSNLKTDCSYHKCDNSINIPKGNYIIHINAKLFNNDITFLDKFDSIDDVVNNPYTINVNLNETTIDSMMLINTTDPLILYNYSTAISLQENSKLTITSNYSDMAIIKINVIVEEILGDIQEAIQKNCEQT